MRAVSVEAFEQVRDRWDTLLTQRNGSEVLFATQVFEVADVLRDNDRLVWAFTDASRVPDDRAALASSVFGGRVAEEVVELLEGMVRQNWASGDDLVESVDAIAVHSLLVSARSRGYLSTVESELHAVRRLLTSERELRLALGDKKEAVERRVALARNVWGSHVKEETLILIARSVECACESSVVSSLTSYVAAAAQLASKLVASVTVASPLSHEQQKRLVDILSRKYGQEVSVHVAVLPEVIGGMRINIGDDVIDATLATRIKSVKDAITK